MSEPPAISRRASAWWPAVVALEEVMDAVTALALAVDRGAPAPGADAVRAVSSVLREACAATASGEPVRGVEVLASSSDEPLAAVVEAVKALLGVLRGGADRLTADVELSGCTAGACTGIQRAFPGFRTEHAGGGPRFAERNSLTEIRSTAQTTFPPPGCNPPWILSPYSRAFPRPARDPGGGTCHAGALAPA
jgi:hypothetical protein